MTPVLREIFNHDFAPGTSPEGFSELFFARQLQLSDISRIHRFLSGCSYELAGVTIPAALRIPGGTPEAPPFLLLAQLHGNEPAGLAGVALVLALSDAGLLTHDVVCAIGNPLAAGQYFEHWHQNPSTRQETRDAFRCGLSPEGRLLPDMNRIPVDFLTRENPDGHTLRARQLYALGSHACGVLDIHSARGNMVCITDHKHDRELKNAPIRALLTGLAEAISAHASAAVSVKTLKTILQPLPNIEAQVGIEAGRHEAPFAPRHAASFTLALLHTLGFSRAIPLPADASNIFEGYAVQPRITYADLDYPSATLRAEDHVYMARACHALASVPARAEMLVVRHDGGDHVLQSIADFTQKPAGSLEYAIYQYDEMEAIEAGQVVAVALPSGTPFRARDAFSGIFLSKSAALYDKDPSVGPWPVAASKLAEVKFCYPCKVGPVALDF